MNLLLDSHAFLWWLQDSRRLSRKARRAIAAPTSQVFVSAVSIWEIAIKLSIGKLRWREGVALDDSIASCGFAELPVSVRHAAGVRNLPGHHADPFDRLLISQALVEELRVVTADEVFTRYAIQIPAAEACGPPLAKGAALTTDPVSTMHLRDWRGYKLTAILRLHFRATLLPADQHRYRSEV